MDPIAHLPIWSAATRTSSIRSQSGAWETFLCAGGHANRVHPAPLPLFGPRLSALRNSFSSHFPGSGSRPHGGCKRLKGMEPVKVSVDFFRTFDFSCHIGYVLFLLRHPRCPICLAIRL